MNIFLIMAVIAYIMTRVIKFELSSSMLVFVGSLLLISDEMRMLALMFIAIIIFQVVKNWNTYKVKYSTTV